MVPSPDDTATLARPTRRLPLNRQQCFIDAGALLGLSVSERCPPETRDLLARAADELLQLARLQFDELPPPVATCPPEPAPHRWICWECGYVATYASDVAPERLCRRCGSHDMRRQREATV